MLCPGFRLFALSIVLLISLPALLGCGEPTEDDPATASCRLNSDCPASQVCVQGACIDDEPCEGEDCLCLGDDDCGLGQGCDLETSRCFDLECVLDSDCGLGEVCLSGLCETDVDADRDRDGVPDTEDSCPDEQNADQEDNDFDGLGDLCDPDDDNDAIPDTLDNCPFDPNGDQFDHDDDNVGNPCDDDFSGLAISGALSSPLENAAFNDIASVTLVGASRVNAIVQPDGGFELPGLLPGLYALEIEADGHFPTTRVLRLEEEDIDLGVIALILQNQGEDGHPLAGQVRLSDGAAPENVIVRARINGELINTTLTDGEGLFVFNAARLDHTIELDKPGYQRTTFEVLWSEARDRFEINSTPVEDFDGFALSPDLSASVSGRLTSSLENVVFNDIATVTLVGASSEHLGVLGPDGDFQVGPVRPGLYGLQVEAAGHIPISQIVSLIAGDNDLGDIALVPEFEAPDQAVAMRGRASLSDGATPSGIIVRARINGVLVTTTLTDSEGVWTVMTARLDHNLEFEKPGYQSASFDVVWSEARDRFEVNGEPLEGVQRPALSPDLSASVAGRLTTGLENVVWSDIASVTLIGEGRNLAVIEPSGGFQIGPVRPGLYALEITAQGHLPVSRAVTLGAGDNDLGDIALIQEAEVTEEAVALTGRVLLGGQQTHGGVVVRGRIGGVLVATTLTDAQGIFTFLTSRLDHSLSFEADGFVPRTIDAVWSQPRIRFETDGQPLSDAVLSLSPEPADGVLNISLSVQPAWIPTAQRHTALNVQGDAFVEARPRVQHTGNNPPERFTGVSTGTYIIQASRAGFSTAQGLLRVDRNNNQAQGTLEVRLQTLSTARLNLAGVTLDRAMLAAAIADGVDFRGADLSGVRLIGDLSGLSLDLSGSDLSDANLSNTNLTGIDLAAANLAGANLAGANLTEAVLTGANLAGANLTSAVFVAPNPPPRDNPCDVPDDLVDLTGALFSQTNLTDAIMDGVLLAGADLSGAVLNGASLDGACLTGVNLTLADLSEASFDGADLNSARFINAILSQTSLRGARMTRADLSSAVTERADFSCLGNTCTDLNNANFNGANIAGADFSGADMGGVSMLGAIMGNIGQTRTRFVDASLDAVQAIGVIFNSADLTGASLQGASLRNTIFAGTLLSNAVFDNADLTQASLTNEQLQGTSMSSAVLRNAVLDTADMTGVDLTAADLTNASLTRVNLENADLTGALLGRAVLTDANLTGVVAPQTPFDNADLSGAVFSGADIAGSSIRFANLSGADLEGVDLSGVTFFGTNLAGANLAGANLDDTILLSANLTAADLTDATIIDTTAHDLSGCPQVLPDGWACAANARARSALFGPSANLRDADLAGTELHTNTFRRVILNGADFRGANIEDFHFPTRPFQAALLHDMIGCPVDTDHDCVENSSGRTALIGSGVDLTGADLTGADLTGTRFNDIPVEGLTAHALIACPQSSPSGWRCTGTGEQIEDDPTAFALAGSGADLEGADLSHANFGSLDLLRANFRNADLSHTNLNSADLTDADLTGANLDNARFNDQTVCPDGRTQDVFPRCGF